MEEEIKLILKEHASLMLVEETKKIRCCLSGHEMPCTIAALKQYIAGKKYKKLLSNAGFDYSKYKQFLPPSNKKKHENHLFCQLTWRHINNEPHHIERHVNGRRFQRAYERWKKCQETGEKYRPRGHYEKKTVDGEDDDPSLNEEFAESDAEQDEISDDLEDLYPAEDFGRLKGDDSSASDFEFEDLENNVPPSIEKKPTKRKAEDVAQVTKKQKSGKPPNRKKGNQKKLSNQ